MTTRGYKRILLPIDGSEYALEAVRYVSRILSPQNIELVIFNVHSKIPESYWDLEREASSPGLFCQGCGSCLQQCLWELPIPDLMRAYMYAYGYRQPALAHSLLASLELPGSVCEDCPSCTVACANGWNVAEKARDIVRLKDVPAGFLV